MGWNTQFVLADEVLVVGSNGQQILIHVVSGVASVEFDSGAVSEAAPASITTIVQNRGLSNERIIAKMSGAESTGGTDYVSMTLWSSVPTTANEAIGELIWTDTTGTDHSQVFWSGTGTILSLTNNITAVKPGTSNSTIASESWHSMSAGLAAGFTAGSQDPEYQLMPIGSTNQVHLRGAVALTANKSSGATFFSLPGGYVPSAAQEWVTASTLSGAGFGGTVQIDTSANLKLGCNGSSGNILRLDGVVIQL